MLFFFSDNSFSSALFNKDYSIFLYSALQRYKFIQIVIIGNALDHCIKEHFRMCKNDIIVFWRASRIDCFFLYILNKKNLFKFETNKIDQ